MVAPNRCVPVNLGSRLDEPQVLPTTGNRANGGWHRTTTDTMRLQDLSLLPHWVIRRPRHQTGEFHHFERFRCKMRTSNNTWQMPHQTDDGRLSNGNQITVENWGLVKTTGLLAPGRQCRLCLMVYQVGQSVRRLQPGCQHIFHSACIDPWLLHRSSTCPLDGIHVTPLASVSKESPLGENYIHSRTTAILPEIQGVKLNASDFRIHVPKPAPRAKLLTSPRKRIAATSGKPSASFEHNLSVVGQGVTASTAHPELGSVGIRKPTQDTFGVENAKFYTNDR
ncbi:unnamed protein product [Dicrocoelium dendriticum]|nr:unnamed protein product [Dicrocoelium dendriticum]